MTTHYTGLCSNRRVWLVVATAGALTVLLFSTVVAVTYRIRMQARRDHMLNEELPRVIRSVDSALQSYFDPVTAGLGLLASRGNWEEQLDAFASRPALVRTTTSVWASHMDTPSVDVTDIQREVVYGYWSDEPIHLDSESERDAWFFEVWKQPDPPETKITFYSDAAVGGHGFYVDQLLRDAEGRPIGTLGVLRPLEPLARRIQKEVAAHGHVYLVDSNDHPVLEVDSRSFTYFGLKYGLKGREELPDGEPKNATAVPYETVASATGRHEIGYTEDDRYATATVRLPIEGMTARIFLDASARLQSARCVAVAETGALLASFLLFFGVFVLTVVWLIRGIRFQANLADRSRNQLDDLLSVLTHNLSNQLHPLRRHVTDMKAKRKSGGDPSGDVSIDARADSVDTILLDMEQVLQNAIYSARLANQQVRPLSSSLDVAAMFRRIEASCRPVAQAKEQELLLANCAEYQVAVDEDLLFHVLLNLVNNAMKFSPRGATVLVAAVDSRTTLDFVIADQGPGFSEADKAHLFEKNRRLSARPTGGERSTGMGLYVTRHIANTLGTELELADSLPAELAAAVDFPGPAGAVWLTRIPARVTIV